MRLEIGCGDKPLKNYIGLDIRNLPQVDIVDDATKLDKIDDNSCEEIKSVQVLEHFSHTQTLNILKLWYSKLKIDGFLHIEVPDLKYFCYRWLKGEIREPWAFIGIFGLQDYEENTHKAGFTIGYLTFLLKIAGFVEIENLMFGKDNSNCKIVLKAYKRKQNEEKRKNTKT